MGDPAEKSTPETLRTTLGKSSSIDYSGTAILHKPQIWHRYNDANHSSLKFIFFDESDVNPLFFIQEVRKNTPVC